MKIHDRCLYAAFGQTVQDQGWFFVQRNLTGCLQAFRDAQAAGSMFIVIFADASRDSSTLVSWSVVRLVESDGAGTRASFDPVQRLPVRKPVSILRKVADGGPISESIRRGQIVCRTPPFIDALAGSTGLREAHTRLPVALPPKAMEHFIAYHSVRTMGYELKKSTGKLRFLSRKLAILRKAIGNTVWVIQGVPNNGKMTYFLRGAYVADKVAAENSAGDLYVISGHLVREFEPQVPLNKLDWFPALFESQRNFSLGFNRIGDETVIQGLTTIQPKSSNSSETNELHDIDLVSIGNEGYARLVSHLRRERNRAIVEAKKAATLKAKGRLCCEACGFDFAVSYGALGDGYCEVHHLVPLSASHAPVSTKIDDLAVLCSNCHRIIHRSEPMLSVAALIRLIKRNRASPPLSASSNSLTMRANGH